MPRPGGAAEAPTLADCWASSAARSYKGGANASAPSWRACASGAHSAPWRPAATRHGSRRRSSACCLPISSRRPDLSSKSKLRSRCAADAVATVPNVAVRASPPICCPGRACDPAAAAPPPPPPWHPVALIDDGRVNTSGCEHRVRGGNAGHDSRASKSGTHTAGSAHIPFAGACAGGVCVLVLCGLPWLVGASDRLRANT